MEHPSSGPVCGFARLVGRALPSRVALARPLRAPRPLQPDAEPECGVTLRHTVSRWRRAGARQRAGLAASSRGGALRGDGPGREFPPPAARFAVARVEADRQPTADFVLRASSLRCSFPAPESARSGVSATISDLRQGTKSWRGHHGQDSQVCTATAKSAKPARSKRTKTPSDAASGRRCRGRSAADSCRLPTTAADAWLRKTCNEREHRARGPTSPPPHKLPIPSVAPTRSLAPQPARALEGIALIATHNLSALRTRPNRIQVSQP
jgi:hypothetical protein